MKTVRKIAAVTLAAVMAVTFMPMIPGAKAEASAAETAKAATTEMTGASVAVDGPSEFTFETDFDALTQKWRRYPKIAFGLDGKEWIVCGKQNNELVMICNPGDSYGQTIFADEAGTYDYSYETSDLDKTLQEMTAKGSKTFSQSEISLMKDVSVTLIGDYSNVSDSKYQISRKLYVPYPNDGTVKLGCGTKDSLGDIQISLADSQFKGASFWTRAVNRATVYKYENGSQVATGADDKSNILPVMHLNLADANIKPLFVSAAEPAKADANIASTAKTPSPQNTTLTMRYDSGNNVKYKAEYNSSGVTVKCDTIVHDEYLYVQWSENNVDKVKSIKLQDSTSAKGGETTYTAEEIGGSGFSLTSGVKVWVEKKIDNLTYASMGTRTRETGPEVPADLKMTRSTNGEADGALSGLDSGVEYEYCLYSKIKAEQDWIKVTKGSTEIKGLQSGNYYIRSAETEKYTAGPARMYRVKDLYDVTIDSDTNKVLINEKDISTYPVFGSLSTELEYSKDGVFNTLSKINDVFDAKAVSGLVGKYASGQAREEFNTYKTVERLGKVSKSLSALSVDTDGSTKEILGDIDSTELKKEWSNAEDSFSKFQESFYDDFTDSRLNDINGFYSGAMADKENVSDIDSSFLYFYSDGNKSQLTGERDDMANGTKMYKTFTEFGDMLLNASTNGEEKKDIFDLCEGVCSYLYNFNNETFSDRDELYNRIFYFYEKGYSAMASSLAYNISNHKNQLNRITDLRTAAVGAETSEESDIIRNAIKTVAKETAKVYGLDSSSYDWTKLENFHNEEIAKEKESLKELNAQYEAVKAAYEDAENYLQAEKNRCNNRKAITCYRNQVNYNVDLQILSVNHKYLSEINSTQIDIFLNSTKDQRASVTHNDARGLSQKYSSPDRSDSEAAALVSDLQSFEKWSEDRGISFDHQMGRAFCFWDTDTKRSVKFGEFSSDDKYSHTLGFYVNGKQEFRTDHTDSGFYVDGDKAYFYRNVSYYKDGVINKTCSAHKEWDITFNTGTDSCVLNDITNNAYVIHLNRVSESGQGGGDGCFMATGKASGTTNKITWNEVEGADGYDVYYARCGKTMKKVKSTSALRYTKKNLNKKAGYKYCVKAYSEEDGVKQYIDKTPVIHIAGTKSAYSNALSVDIDKDYLNMNAGENAKLTGKITKKSSKKPVLWKNHVKSRLRYMSSDETVVTVNNKGQVTAKAPGYAYIYVYAASGAHAGIEVTVTEQ